MTVAFNTYMLSPLREKVNEHPVFHDICDLDDLRCFMSHHVFAVWDFMSLLKSLQAHLAPASQPWVPLGRPQLRRFINQIVLEEESDEGLPVAEGQPTYLSHFELYHLAMTEIGADPAPSAAFARRAAEKGIDYALAHQSAPQACKRFIRQTFDFIASGRPHVVAAVFALGREQIIPAMFGALLRNLGVEREQAPAFHYYLDRHIHLDEGQHGPISLSMVEELLEGRPARLREAKQAAHQALKARIRLWDDVVYAIAEGRRQRLAVAT